MVRRLLVALSFAVVVLMPGSVPATAQDASPVASPIAAATPLDLAAMTLTPDDLADNGFADYVIADGRTQTLQERLVDPDYAKIDPNTLRTALSQMGWLRQYRIRLAHPTAPGSQDFDALIATAVTQTATVDGATMAFDSTVASASRTGASVDRPSVIGDQSEMFQLAERGSDGTMHPELRLVFRHGVLACDLIVFGPSGATLNVDDIEALAERQIERMDQVLAGNSPGLSLKVLRWRGVGINDPDVDNYLKLDGTMYLVLGDAESDAAITSANYKDATDHYRYEVALTESLFQFTSVAQFSTDEVATGWVRDAFARTDRNRTADTTLERVAVAPLFGDESVVLRATTPIEGGTAFAYAVFFAIGDQAVSLAIISLSDLDVANVTAMAADQVACFEAGDCTESVPLPSWIGA